MRLGQELQRRGEEVAIFSRAPASVHPGAPTIPVFAGDGPTPFVIATQLLPALEAFRPTHLVIQYTAQMLGASRFGSPATLWLARAAHRAGAKVVVLAHELFLPWSRRPDWPWARRFTGRSWPSS